MKGRFRFSNMQSFEEDRNSQVGLIDRSAKRCVLPPAPLQSRDMMFDDDCPVLVQSLTSGTTDLEGFCQRQGDHGRRRCSKPPGLWPGQFPIGATIWANRLRLLQG